MQIKDSLTVDASGLSRSVDGYLIGTAKVSRAGNVQDYYGYEIGLKADDTGKVFGVYRDPDVVFDEAAMASLAGRPVTRNHPPEGVNSKTWRDLAVGVMGGRVVRDGEHIVASMAIMDALSADEVEAGASSLSAGYTVGITKDEGTAPDGTPYQYRQSGSLRFNHVAYLPDNNPRAGNTRIGDSQPVTVARWGAPPITDEKDVIMADAIQTRTVLIDGLSVVTTDAGAQALEKLQGQITDVQTALAAKDGELAAKDAKIAEMAKATLSDADLDAKVAARADLIGKAKAIAKDVETTGLSDAAIRKAAVVAVMGDATLTGKPDAYIDAYFDILSEDAAKGDPVADALTTGVTVATDARAEYVKSLGTAYLQPVGKGA